MSLSQRVLGAVDLAIEFATLGEYGLERIDIAHGGRERSGRAKREARRADCMGAMPSAQVDLASAACSTRPDAWHRANRRRNRDARVRPNR